MQHNTTPLDRVLFGDNQFFGVNHASDEKSRAQAMRFKDDESIIRVLDQAYALGVRTFMCTTHDRIAAITAHMRANPGRYEGFKIYPCMPYAISHANAVTELGIMSTINQYVPGNFLTTFAKGGMAMFSSNYSKLMEILIDAEMKMFEGIDTPVIFIQNVLVDMILGLGMYDVFKDYDAYIRKKYNAEPGYITMNMPDLLDALESVGIRNHPSSVPPSTSRASGCRAVLSVTSSTSARRPSGPSPCRRLPPVPCARRRPLRTSRNFRVIESVLFGSGSKQHIAENIEMIESSFAEAPAELSMAD